MVAFWQAVSREGASPIKPRLSKTVQEGFEQEGSRGLLFGCPTPARGPYSYSFPTSSFHSFLPSFIKHTALKVTSWTGPGGRETPGVRSLSACESVGPHFCFGLRALLTSENQFHYAQLILRPTHHVYHYPLGIPPKHQIHECSNNISVIADIYKWRESAA